MSRSDLHEELRELQQRVEESEEKFHQIADCTVDWEMWIDQDGRLRWLNPSVEKTTGYSLDECYHHPTYPFFIVHPEDRERIRGYLECASQGISGSDLEFRILHKNGELRWGSIAWQPISDTQGRSLGHRASVRDITATKRMREEIERRSNQLSALHETVLELNAELNLPSLLRSIALRALNLIGGSTCNVFLYKPETDLLELDQSAGESSYPPEYQVHVRRRGQGLVGQILATGAPLLINDYRAWPGRIRTTDRFPSRAMVGVPVRWGEEFLGVINISAQLPHQFTQTDLDMLGMFASQAAIAIRNARLYEQMRRDLTERRRLESERRQMQQQFLQSQKMEAVGTLAGGIAHDFNNILMGIQGHLSLMQIDLPPGHPFLRRLEKIETLVSSGAGLTRQLLGFARGGKYEVNITNLNEIIEKSLGIFSRTNKELTVRRVLRPGIRSIEADQGQIEQVLLNLCINASQAMPGGGELTLETCQVTLNELEVKPHGVRPGRYVQVLVSDTGTGMDERTRERLFEPFFTTKEPGKGTGLGLASAYGIMKNHGGFITVASELGKGSTFTLYFPTAEKSDVAGETPVKKVLKGQETILVVDDEVSNVEVTRELLESLGYRVLSAGNGQEAIAIYMDKAAEIDMVILDLIMPGMGGGKTFDALRTINPGVKVLLASGYSVDGEARKILDRGCNGFVQKPFRLADFSAKIRDVLKK